MLACLSQRLIAADSQRKIDPRFGRGSHAEPGATPLSAITFPGPVSRYVASALQSAGLRFNNQLDRWEGRAHFAKAEALANSYGGTIHHVGGETEHPRDDLAAAAE
jgi:hypothetical protein